MTAESAGGRTILAVDDEPDLLEAVRRILTREGHTVVTAATVDGALRLCGSHPGPIDLLLTDVLLPDGRGHELAAQATQLRPDLRVVFVSGLADAGLLGAAESGQPTPTVVSKPFTPRSLAEAVAHALSAPSSR
jgi:CheY-like chemotaxis protein